MDEEKKYEVIKNLADHSKCNKQRAALILGCIVRHINRMLVGYRKSGKEFFIHGNKGKEPINSIPKETKSIVLALYRNRYYDANFTHFTESLSTNENITIFLHLFQRFWNLNIFCLQK